MKRFLAMLVSGVWLMTGISMSNADTTASSRFRMTIEAGGETQGFELQDFKSANLIVHSKAESYTGFCLIEAAATRLNAFLSNHLGDTATVMVGDSKLGSFQVQGGFRGGCGVLGAYPKPRAEKIRAYIRGETNILTLGIDDNAYCPDRDFIRICLSETTADDDLRAIVEAEEGEWVKHEASSNSDNITIRLEKLEIHLTREKFSDLVVTTCHTLDIINENENMSIGCPQHFSRIDEIMGTSAVVFEARDFSYSPVLEWQGSISGDNVIVIFDTFPKNSPDFQAIRWGRK